jgi:glycosyltransferase involved in cell wall biosynthesis
MAATTAIACGLPIVATRVGALGEAVGNAGILVPPNDSLALADALRRVIADPDVRRKLGHASRAAARNLPTWRDTAERIAAAIELVA